MSGFPVLDYVNRQPEDAKRLAKSKKFNNRYSARINELSEQIFYTIEWESGLPALPVKRSAAVVIGQVTDAQVYLSEDQTNVYSEFTIKVDEVLKSEDKTPIKSGDLVAAQRLGGRIRFPSGKIMVSQVNSQDMPKVGSKYAFFLTHEFPTNSVLDEGLFILTAYELKGNKVFPLDKTALGHPISTYKGTDVGLFMADLLTAIQTNP